MKKAKVKRIPKKTFADGHEIIDEYRDFLFFCCFCGIIFVIEFLGLVLWG